jgi:hypothetical protein
MPAYCNLLTSRRLQAVVRPLLDGRAHSTMDLVRASGQCAVDTAIRELRQPPNGLTIHRVVRTEPDRDGRNRSIHYYQLAPESRRSLLQREAQRLLDEAQALVAEILIPPGPLPPPGEVGEATAIPGGVEDLV